MLNCTKIFLPLIASSFAFEMLTSSISAQPADEPLELFPVTDGVVYSVAKSGNTLYLGGTFKLAGVRTGSGVPLSLTTGDAEATYPSVNGDVDVVISDGQGGWYIGGAFSKVGGTLRANLAHIRSDRTVDPSWSPAALGGPVRALLLSGNTVYIGGGFTNVNGQIRNGAAAVDITSGSVNGWNPNVNGTVDSLALNGTNIFLGGLFTTVGGQARNSIGAVDSIRGQVTSWDPGMGSNTGSPPEVHSLVAAGEHLFAGGYFATVAGQSRSCAASFTISSGSLDSWNPALGSVGIVSPTVFGMAAYGNTIFVAGVFGSAGGSSRLNIAQLDATTGLATSWDAHEVLFSSSGLVTDEISSMGIYGDTVYIGGNLINIGGQPRGFAAGLDANTGLATAWNPQPNFFPLTFAGSGNAIYMGGVFSSVGGVARTNLAGYDLSTHQITPLTATFSGLTNAAPSINALLVISNQLYVGGFFTNINGVTVSNLAGFDLTTGLLNNWNPNPNGIVNALANWNDRIYAGGFFTSIEGIARTNFAEFLLNDGSMTSWDPGFSRSQIYTLAVDGDTLYAGGGFSSVGGVARSRVAAFDLTTDTLTAFDPGVGTGASQVRSITVQNGRVYAAGHFNSVAGFAYTNYFSINADMSNLFPPHNVDGTIYSLSVSSNTVFLGGAFSTVDGHSRTNLAALDTFTDTLMPWNPTTDYGYLVENVSAIDGTLYVSGQFFHAGNETARGIAAFPLAASGSSGRADIVSNSTRRLVDGSIQFFISAPAGSQATIQTSTNLTDWLPLQTVPVANGNGIFTDTNATSFARRFYRLSVP